MKHETLIAVTLLCLVSACGGTPTGPDTLRGNTNAQPSPAPAPASGQVAINGRVIDEDSGQPLAAVKVDAVSGSASFTLTTDVTGAFRMELPPGVARFRLSKEGYVSYDKEHTIQAGTTALQIPLKKVAVPPPAPPQQYTLRGSVTDLQGNPLQGAGVVGYRNDSPVDDAVGRTSTDASGRFILTTTRMPQDVQVSKTGYEQTKARVGLFSADSTATITIMVARFVRYVLLPPASVRVGQSVQITARVELDNGSAFVTPVRALSSSNPSVLSVIDADWVKGVAPGTATLTGSHNGVTGTVSLRVDP
jgi:hypothetical protein